MSDICQMICGCDHSTFTTEALDSIGGNRFVQQEFKVQNASLVDEMQLEDLFGDKRRC